MSPLKKGPIHAQHVRFTGKYGRYIADLWYKPGSDDPDEILAHGTLLNQELLDQGLAELYEG